MIVNVQMAGHPQVFQFASRRDVSRLLKAANEDGDDFARVCINAFVKTKETANDWGPWRPVRVRHLRRGSIESIVSAEDKADSDADLPAKAIAEARLAAYEKREAEEAEARA